MSVTNVRLVCLLPIVAYTYACRFWATVWYNLKCVLLQYYIWIIECIVRFKNTHRSELVQSIQSCGIHFQIGKGAKKMALEILLKILNGLFLMDLTWKICLKTYWMFWKESKCLNDFYFFFTKSKVIKLWRDCYQFYAIMKNINPPKGDIQSFHERTKQWVNA